MKIVTKDDINNKRINLLASHNNFKGICQDSEAAKVPMSR